MQKKLKKIKLLLRFYFLQCLPLKGKVGFAKQNSDEVER